MPRVIVTERAGQGLKHCRQFLAIKNPRAARRAGQIIEQQCALLETTPDIGRLLPELPALRELIIGFGDSGYVALWLCTVMNQPTMPYMCWLFGTRKKQGDSWQQLLPLFFYLDVFKLKEVE